MPNPARLSPLKKIHRKSYVVFQYEDVGIEWTTGDASGGTNGLGGVPATIGFNEGITNGIYYTLAESGTAAIINVTQTSNVNVPGRYIFGVDGIISTPSVCSYTTFVYTVGTTDITTIGASVLDDTVSQIAAEKTCYKLESTGYYGGWLVTYNSEDLCCSTRGTYNASLNALLTGCNKGYANLYDFYVPSDAVNGDYGYKDCYKTGTTSDCLSPQISSGTYYANGAVAASSSLNTSVNRFNMIQNTSTKDDGSYVLDLATNYVYCTGKGAYNSADGLGGACRQNTCGTYSEDFIYIGSSLVDNTVCYYNCWYQV